MTPTPQVPADISDEWQQRWWCNCFGCTIDELLAAIRVVGVDAENVRRYIEQMKRER